jgi:hypothetical protein
MGKHFKSVQITDSNLYNEICNYCKVNGLKIGSFITDMLRKQFIVEQYGDTPFGEIGPIKPVLIPEFKATEAVEIPLSTIEMANTEAVKDGPNNDKVISKELYGEIKFDGNIVSMSTSPIEEKYQNIEPPQNEVVKKPKKRRL